LNAFCAADGGANNAVNSATSAGFRTINWDAVKLDGTDFGGGGNTTVISNGNTVGIPRDRFQQRGAFFDEVYAVSGNGFATVNPTVTGLFPAFSPSNTFAPFNGNVLDVAFVVPTGANATGPVVPAATRGFGAIFENVELASTTTIEYFAGGQSLGKFNVPAGTSGQTEFLGELFASPVVTAVQIVLGTDTIFTFNGTTFSSNTTDTPGTGHNLVATDDFAYAEPQPIANAAPVVDGPQGVSSAVAVRATALKPFTGTVATFHTTIPTQTASSFKATINWGDGHTSNGTVAANTSGGFDVSGTNTYALPGLYPVSVLIQDFSGNTATVINTVRANEVFIATG